jgi:adenine phosphoribosyltransferase
MSDTEAGLNLRDFIRDIPDFPKPGIVFKDITPLLADGEAFCTSISQLASYLPEGIDAIVGIEARGFIFGAGLAQHSRIGLIPVRKPGKLPAEVHGIDYDLEYGVDRLEIHRDSLTPGHRVVIIDDLLASGGTVCATIDLVRKLGAEVAACLFVVELKGLDGRKRCAGVPVHSLITYD